MQNIRPQVCQALEGALAGKAAVYQVYPAAEAAPPLAVFQEIQNHPLAQADGQEYLTEILYQIDLYAETTQEADALAPAVEKALAALGRITGQQVDEKLLDDVFSRFCVGK